MQALWMALGALFFALMGVCIKLASGDYSSMEIVFYRGLTGLLMFGTILRVRGIPLATPVPRLHVQRNLAGVTAMSLWFYAIANLPFATGMTLNNMSSVWLGVIVVAGVWWRSGKLQYPALFATVLCGFAGVVLLLDPRIDGTPLLPGLMGLCSGILSALAYMQVSALGKAGEPEDRTVFYFSMGTAVLGLLSAFVFGHGLSPLQARSVWLLPAIGVFASMGQWCLTRAYSNGSTLVVACLQYLGIVYAALFGVLIFHDQLRPSAWLGMAVIVISGVLATLLRQHYVRRANAAT